MADSLETKTGGDSVRPGAFAKGHDSRRGVGKKGRSGRPPSELREKLRGSLEKRVKIAEQIADSPTASDTDRLRALDFLAKYGLGTTQTQTDADGNDAPPPGRLTPNEMRDEIVRALATREN